jgi:Icc protein
MRIAHISDFHLPTKKDSRANGVLPHANLDLAVETLKAQNPKPNLIMLGGDLLEDGEKGSYQVVAEKFKDFEAPVHTVLGNHDHLKSFKKSSLARNKDHDRAYYSFDHNKVHVVVLYSVCPKKQHGRLDEEQLLWLSVNLYENRGKPVVIFLHHPPFDSGVAWLDKIKLLNDEEFWNIVPPYSKNILGVFASHFHIQLFCKVKGVLSATNPAVCWQFSGNSSATKDELSDEQPGFNLIDIADTEIRVRTVRFSATQSAPSAEKS